MVLLFFKDVSTFKMNVLRAEQFTLHPVQNECNNGRGTIAPPSVYQQKCWGEGLILWLLGYFRSHSIPFSWRFITQTCERGPAWESLEPAPATCTTAIKQEDYEDFNLSRICACDPEKSHYTSALELYSSSTGSDTNLSLAITHYK